MPDVFDDIAPDQGQAPPTVGALVDKYSEKYHVDPRLALAVIRSESAGNAYAVGPVTRSGEQAVGLMQLMPDTARDMGVKNRLDPEQNIEGGIKYLSQMLDRYHGDRRLAIAAYNAGPDAVDRAGGIPNYPETQAYTRKVMSLAGDPAETAQGGGDIFDEISPDRPPMSTPPGGWEAQRPGMARPPLPLELMTEDQLAAYRRATNAPVFVNPRTGRPSYSYQGGGPLAITQTLPSGLTQMVEGAEQLAGPVQASLQAQGRQALGQPAGITREQAEQELSEAAKGTHQIVTGAMEAGTPLLPGMVAGAPVATAIGLGLGTGAQVGVSKGLEALGLPQEYADVAGDLAGVIAGAAGLSAYDRMLLRARIRNVLQDRLNADYARRQAQERFNRLPRQLEAGEAPPPEAAPRGDIFDAVEDEGLGPGGPAAPQLGQRGLLRGATPGEPGPVYRMPSRTPGMPGTVYEQPPAIGAQRLIEAPGPLARVVSGDASVSDLSPQEFRQLMDELAERQRGAAAAAGARATAQGTPATDEVREPQAGTPMADTREADQAQAERQPWQMTADEYLDSRGIKAGKRQIQQAHEEHSRAVYGAMEKGLPVPPEVLKEYPGAAQVEPAPKIAVNLSPDGMYSVEVYRGQEIVDRYHYDGKPYGSAKAAAEPATFAAEQVARRAGIDPSFIELKGLLPAPGEEAAPAAPSALERSRQERDIAEKAYSDATSEPSMTTGQMQAAMDRADQYLAEMKQAGYTPKEGNDRFSGRRTEAEQIRHNLYWVKTARDHVEQSLKLRNVAAKPEGQVYEVPASRLQGDYPGPAGDIGKSYSADRISEGGVRKPFKHDGSEWVTTRGAVGKVEQTEAYRLVPRSEFKGETATYGRAASERAGGAWKKQGLPGFYHGMEVKRGKETWVLQGPPATFKAAPEGSAPPAPAGKAAQGEVIAKAKEALKNIHDTLKQIESGKAEHNEIVGALAGARKALTHLPEKAPAAMRKALEEGAQQIERHLANAERMRVARQMMGTPEPAPRTAQEISDLINQKVQERTEAGRNTKEARAIQKEIMQLREELGRAIDAERKAKAPAPEAKPEPETGKPETRPQPEAGSKPEEAAGPISEYKPGSGRIPNPSESRFTMSGPIPLKSTGEVWHTDGHFAAVGEPPENWKAGGPGGQLPDLDRVLPKEPGKTVQPVGFWNHEIARRTHNRKSRQQRLITFSNGHTVYSMYYDYVTRRLKPDRWASPNTEAKKPEAVQAWKGDKLVAVVMPLRIDDDYPAAIRKLIDKSAFAPKPGMKPRRKSEQGSLSVDLATLGLSKLIKNDVVPSLEAAGAALKVAADDIRKIFAPASRTSESKLTAQSVRAHAAEMARSRDRAEAALNVAGKYFDSQTPEDNYKFIERVEAGERQPNEKLQAIANAMRHILDSRRDAIRALGTGKLQNWIENYFPHIWQDKDAGQIYENLRKRPFEGSKAFLKKRSIDSIAHGLEMGLTPVSDNPVDLVLMKAREMDKYLMAHSVLKELKELGITQFLDARDILPKGWAHIDDKVATIFGRPTVQAHESFDPHVMRKLEALAESLGIPHERLVKLKSEGLAYKGGGNIKTKFGSPESVLAHEIGHQLEWKFGLSGRLKGKPGIAQDLKNLADLRYEGMPNVPESYKTYVRGKDEKMANAIAALVYAPEKFKQTAPELWDALRDELWHIPQLKPVFDIKPGMVLEGRQAEIPVPGLVIKGHWIAPEPAARVLNNYLSPGLEKSGLYRTYLGAANLLNSAQLGWSAFHAGFTTAEAAISRFALGVHQLAHGSPLAAARSFATVPAAPFTGVWKGHKMMSEWMTPGSQSAEIGAMVDAVVQAGGRAHMDAHYATRISEAMMRAFRQGNILGGAIRVPFAATEQAIRPIMEWLVPRQKMAAFADLAQFELERLGPDASREQVRAALGRAWDSIDNRFGQLVYDNLFWNKVAKDLALATVRSVGWNVGTIRELAGAAPDTAKFGARKGDFTPRMSYAIALPIMAGIMGATLYYLWHGEAPKNLKDTYFPRDSKGQRWSLPTYMKDVHGWYQDPRRTARNKIHPFATMLWEMATNEDYREKQIRNPNDPALKQLKDEMKFVGEQWLPLSVKNQRQASDKDWMERTLPFVGVTPAPKSLDHPVRRWRRVPVY